MFVINTYVYERKIKYYYCTYVEPVFFYFLLSNDLAVTFFRALSAGCCIIFLQKLTSEDLSNDFSNKMVKIHPEVTKPRLRVKRPFKNLFVCLFRKEPL